MKREIRLSGSGGQGLILAGVILAEGAIMSDLDAVQSQSYGPEARGGASKAEVIISDKDINFPKVGKSDILISLTQKSFDEYSKYIKENSIVIVDDSIDVGESMNAKIYKVAILDIAKEVLKKPMTANIITLGALSNLIPQINPEHIKFAISNRVPKGMQELNIKAFEEGRKILVL
ncbi:MAG: 2-oxoacid:acceptor oxidoreductase family protein [Romboutsia sp.]|uniref:2-oxoacid:acceptor oxidoreductase family protein n=1 Tax=Romboutsia sp. TaxID=1965302 RepID=UPI003F32EA06